MGHTARQNCLLSQRFGQHFRTLTIWRKTAEYGQLRVVRNDFLSLFAVVFVQLCKGLDDRNDEIRLERLAENIASAPSILGKVPNSSQ